MVRQHMFALGMGLAMGAVFSGTSEAGWGSLGSYGSYGSSAAGYGSYGSSGASYGSSGGGYSAKYTAYRSASYSYGSYGSSGGYASSGASTGGSSGYASSSYGSSGGGSAGSHRGGLLHRLVNRIRSHRATKQSAYGSSGGSYGSSGGSYASSGGSYGSSSYYRSSYGSSSYGSSGYYKPTYHGGSSGASAYYGGYESAQPMIYDSYQGDAYDGGYYDGGYDGGDAIQNQPRDGDSNLESVPREGSDTDVEARVSDDTAILTVAVPADARVYVNDEATESEGPVRQYISHGLREGYSYTYVVRVEQMVDGEKLTDVKRVRLRAGSTERLVFDLPEAGQSIAASGPSETVLTLVVPEDAKVTLAGNDTKVAGNVRTYRTTRLTAGETWDNYTVRVSVTRGGRELSKEQTISLRGGSEEKLAFDFSDTELASR